jgi:hypothetical protein
MHAACTVRSSNTVTRSDACIQEEDTCMSYEERNTCIQPVLSLRSSNTVTSSDCSDLGVEKRSRFCALNSRTRRAASRAMPTRDQLSQFSKLIYTLHDTLLACCALGHGVFQ